MTEPTQEQMNKLPKWAQDYIGNILRERYEAQRQMEEAQQMFSQGVSNQTWRADASTAELDMPSSSVKFYFNRELRHYVEVSFRMLHTRTVLDVRGNGSLKVEPQASNLIYVTSDR